MSLAARARWIAWALMTLTVVGCACEESEDARACRALAERIATCSPQLPEASVDEARTVCEVSLATPPSAPGVEPSLADDQAAIFRGCTDARTCDEITRCLAACQWIVTGPDDRTPSLQCF